MSISAARSAERGVSRVKERLGRSVELISAADLEWLADEAVRIEEARRKLLTVEKGPLDFAAMSPPPPPFRG